MKNLEETASVCEGAYMQCREKFSLLMSTLMVVALPSTGNKILNPFSHNSFLIRVATPSLGALFRGSGGRLRKVLYSL